ncbi:MAG: RluA family pseudouridine synthase [Candidatus Eisenbacteria bacterium]|nr:RluA family pseudouridine synthase [Candidatus Latescibacterota bacterium]MBD3302056.1 RluA family pseudouridine synthase [Candidatus Eisenbacteria bacterium]
MRLDLFLARTFPYRSRTGWVTMIRDERILRNGGPARPGRTLREGDRIEYLPDPQPEPRVNGSYRIVYEDEALLAVAKPADLPVHPSGRYFRNTLLMMLLADRGEALDAAELRIVHRLDRETSGVILFGKGRKAASILSTQFERRTVRKRYLAVVHGVPGKDRFLIDAPIGPDPRSPIRKAMTVIDGGRASRTGVRVLRRGPAHALVAVRPYTGRLHQIRVHLRHAGYPIVGDKVYGVDSRLFLRFIEGRLRPEDRRRLVWGRQALHAWELRVRHPESDRSMLFRAPAGSGWIRRAERLGLYR